VDYKKQKQKKKKKKKKKSGFVRNNFKKLIELKNKRKMQEFNDNIMT